VLEIARCYLVRRYDDSPKMKSGRIHGQKVLKLAQRCLIVGSSPYRTAFHFVHLKLVDLVLAVSKLLQVAIELALVGRALLATANSLVQTGRSADEDLDLLALFGLGENGLQQLLGDVALAALPCLRRVVQDVKGAESLWVCVLEVLPFALQEDILLRDVAKDQGDLCLIVGVLEDGSCSLPHGCDSGSASNEGNVLTSMPN
jgi:hypothetical protein